MFSIILNFFDLLLIPLVSIMPAGAIIFLKFVIAFFTVFLIGKLLRWLWDILPMI